MESQIAVIGPNPPMQVMYVGFLVLTFIKTILKKNQNAYFPLKIRSGLLAGNEEK